MRVLKVLSGMARTIAVGDIHGCSLALDALLAVVEPTAADVLVVLGDYVNRGPNTRGVLDRLIELERICQLVPILGNHDEIFLDVLSGASARGWFLGMGGEATLASYGGVRLDNLQAIPRQHVAFLRRCRDAFESESHLFFHAQYVPHLAVARQPPRALRWEKLRDVVPPPHVSGKRAIVGHSAQKSGEILDLGHIVCIDTFCYGGGWLTALDVESGQVWQVDHTGRLRS